MDMDGQRKCDTHTSTEDYYSAIKKILAIYDNMGGPWGLYAKWKKSERCKYGMILLICERTGWWLLEAVGRGVGEMSKGGQNVQAFSYKTNEFWEYMYSVVTVVTSTVLHIWKLLRE